MEVESVERHFADAKYNSSTDEDTEDASEPDMFEDNGEVNDRDKSYNEKLTFLKEQLKKIRNETDPELLKKMEELREIRDKRAQIAETFKDYELKIAREEYERERSQALQEFAVKKSEIKESLVIDLQEKKKTFESLRATMEITTGSFLVEPKMMVTRKLRRRNFDSNPVQDKRRRTSPFCSALIFELEENEIDEDVKIICKGRSSSFGSINTSNRIPSTPAPTITATTPDQNLVYDVRVEDGKLHYEGKCFGKNQHIIVDSKDRGVETAVISSISHSEIIVKLLPDHAKLRIYLSHLSKGKYVIKKKS